MLEGSISFLAACISVGEGLRDIRSLGIDFSSRLSLGSNTRSSPSKADRSLPTDCPREITQLPRTSQRVSLEGQSVVVIYSASDSHTLENGVRCFVEEGWRSIGPN